MNETLLNVIMEFFALLIRQLKQIQLQNLAVLVHLPILQISSRLLHNGENTYELFVGKLSNFLDKTVPIVLIGCGLIIQVVYLSKHQWLLKQKLFFHQIVFFLIQMQKKASIVLLDLLLLNLKISLLFLLLLLLLLHQLLDELLLKTVRDPIKITIFEISL